MFRKLTQEQERKLVEAFEELYALQSGRPIPTAKEKAEDEARRWAEVTELRRLRRERQERQIRRIVSELIAPLERSVETVRKRGKGDRPETVPLLPLIKAVRKRLRRELSRDPSQAEIAKRCDQLARSATKKPISQSFPRSWRQ